MANNDDGGWLAELITVLFEIFGIMIAMTFEIGTGVLLAVLAICFEVLSS
jgi:hypothetical protein